MKSTPDLLQDSIPIEEAERISDYREIPLPPVVSEFIVAKRKTLSIKLDPKWSPEMWVVDLEGVCEKAQEGKVAGFCSFGALKR